MSNFRPFLKNILFVFFVFAFNAIITILFANSILSEKITLLLNIILLIISAPIYFFVKGDYEKTWLYDIVTLLSYLIFGVLSYYLLKKAFSEVWAMTAWTALFIMIFFACIIALDLICYFFGWLDNSKRK